MEKGQIQFFPKSNTVHILNRFLIITIRKGNEDKEVGNLKPFIEI